MNILIIGLGSMGKRRIRLLKIINPEYKIIGVDNREERREEAKGLYGMETFSSIDEAKQEWEVHCAFVCSSPLSHNLVIRKCLENKWNVFTELNLTSEGYAENIGLAKKNGCILFLSSTFLYREEVRYIRKYIDNRKHLNYIYHIGQYLPDWHPWENYKDFFVNDKRTNGCREIMAIELPWLIEVFGDVLDFYVLTDKMSNLEIEYNDNYMIELRHANGNKGILVIDVVCPVAVRNLEVYGEKIFLTWDGTPKGLRHFDSKEQVLVSVGFDEKIKRVGDYNAFIVEDAYQNEIQDFLNILSGKKKQRYGFEKDFGVLHLIDRIEEQHA